MDVLNYIRKEKRLEVSASSLIEIAKITTTLTVSIFFLFWIYVKYLLEHIVVYYPAKWRIIHEALCIYYCHSIDFHLKTPKLNFYFLCIFNVLWKLLCIILYTQRLFELESQWPDLGEKFEANFHRTKWAGWLHGNLN